MKRKPESFIKPPTYPGGKKAMDEFIKSNLKYPDEALEKKVEGIVTINFDIDVFGTVSNTKIKHGIGSGCDEEALRLVSLMKFSKRKYQGLRVVFHQTMNINFRIHEASKPPDPEQTINYSYSEKPKPNDSGLGYTIDLNS